MLKKFIQAEIIEVNSPQHSESYQAIRYFIQSEEIRRGEFEGHCFIINKIDANTFILYEEYETPNGVVYSSKSKIVDKKTLLNSIDEAAQKIGIYIS